MQRNTIWLSREGRRYCVSYSFNGECTSYVAKKVDEREMLAPLTFTDCLRIADSLPKEFYSRKVKVDINRVDSPLIDALEEDAFRAFIRLCEISSR
jgi:hypothetical protein